MVATANGSPEPVPAEFTLENYRPVRDYIVGKKISDRKTASGIALPDNCQTGPPKVLVLRRGPGAPNNNNPTIIEPMDCEPGDVVHVHGELAQTWLGKEMYVTFQNWQIVSHCDLERQEVQKYEPAEPVTA